MTVLPSRSSTCGLTGKEQFSEAGWMVEHLEATPIEVVICSTLRVPAIHAKIDSKNGAPLYQQCDGPAPSGMDKPPLVRT